MHPIHILLVEDNEGDIVLTREAFEESRIINELSIVRNGKDALDFILRQGEHQQAPVPDLILLDINLPLKNGLDVLRQVKEDDRVKHIPVIMLTTSSAERDIALSYQYHANCFITKPVEINRFLEAISGIEHFWLNIVKLPHKH